MKYKYLFIFWLIPVTCFCQEPEEANVPVISSEMYKWKAPQDMKAVNMRVTTIFAGSAHDMEHLQLMACSLSGSQKKTSMEVPSDEEHLLIVKSGRLQISFRDSTWSLEPGSIALLMPGEKYHVQNTGWRPLLFYRMQYRSKSPADLARGIASGGSFVRDWSKLSFRKHDRGGIRRYFETPTAMCKRFEMHVTTLNPGIKSHEPHTHRAEEIVLVMENSDDSKNETEMQIGDQFFKGGAGDIYYLGSNVPHAIRNRGTAPCSYFAFQFE